MIYLATFILAFCSIVYELLLSQSLSAFMGNTVLRYCTTIGLYMFSMGVGAFIAEGRITKRPVISLQWIEIGLTILGGSSVVLLFIVDSFFTTAYLIPYVAHILIITIGLMSGAEIPLLMEIRNLEQQDQENAVLGVDYIGAFFGTIIFAFVLYPVVGILPSTFLVAFLNSVVGIMLFTQGAKISEGDQKAFRRLLASQVVLALILFITLCCSTQITEHLTNLYVSA